MKVKRDTVWNGTIVLLILTALLLGIALDPPAPGEYGLPRWVHQHLHHQR